MVTIMLYSEFSIQLHMERLLTQISKKSTSNKQGGIMLESYEIIRQLQRENAAIKAKLEPLADRNTPKVPEIESLADRNCPVCGAGIPWDALNDSINDAPPFCQNCGQAFDWSKEPKFHEEEY